jgi:pimeloyl-ACP methyl ester carboxylesterase
VTRAYQFEDELYDAQWLRATGHASYGGAELGECLAIARTIGTPDASRWYNAWFEMAERLHARAQESADRGQGNEACAAYLRASNYYRASYTFLMSRPVDARLVDAYRRQRVSFRNAMPLLPMQAQVIEIEYAGKCLHGYLFLAAAEGPRPVLIITGGYDSTAEECYFFSARAAVERGYHCIVFDGPGQGGALIEDGLPFRPDWEHVIAPVVDFALLNENIDKRKIALLGISFGGYLAPRAASGDARIAACIADPGEYSLLEEMKARLPALLAARFPEGNRIALSIFKAALRRRLSHPTKGWGLRRCLWAHDLASPWDFMLQLSEYSLAARVTSIRCPTLVCSAESDELGASADMLFNALTGAKQRIAFTNEEGAGAHCESGARPIFNERVLDWLDGVLGVGPSAASRYISQS